MSDSRDWHFEIWEDGERRPNAEILTTGEGEYPEGWGLPGPSLEEIRAAFAEHAEQERIIGVWESEHATLKAEHDAFREQVAVVVERVAASVDALEKTTERGFDQTESIIDMWRSGHQALGLERDELRKRIDKALDAIRIELNAPDIYNELNIEQIRDILEGENDD